MPPKLRPEVAKGTVFESVSAAVLAVKLEANASGKTVYQENRNKTGCYYRCYLTEAGGDACAFFLSLRPTHQEAGAWKCIDYVDHTCQAVGQGKTKGMRKAVAHEMHQLVSETLVNAKTLAKVFQLQTGIAVSVKVARSAISLVEEQVFGSTSESYKKLADFFGHLSEENPGTVAHVHRVDGHFHHAFLALSCSISAFQSLDLKFLTMDGAFLKGEVKGHLLALSAVDAESCIMPLALGVFPFIHECNDAWRFFLQHVVGAFGSLEGKTVVTDRRTGLDGVIREVLPGVHHLNCVFHLRDNVRSHMKCRDFDGYVFALAKAENEEIFNKRVEAVRRCQPEKAEAFLEYILASQATWADVHVPEGTTRALSKTGDQAHYCSNASESLNSSLLEARKTNVLSLFDKYWRKVSFFFEKNQKEANIHARTILPVALMHVNANCDRAVGLTQTATGFNLEGGHMHNVSDENGHNFRVDTPSARVPRYSCTCTKAKLLPIPCAHICCVLLAVGTDACTLIDDCLRYGAYRSGYMHGVRPPLRSTWQMDNTLPPANAVGRNRGEGVERRRESAGAAATEANRGNRRRRRSSTIRCGRCGGESHNRNSCTVTDEELAGREPQAAAQARGTGRTGPRVRKPAAKKSAAKPAPKRKRKRSASGSSETESESDGTMRARPRPPQARVEPGHMCACFRFLAEAILPGPGMWWCDSFGCVNSKPGPGCDAAQQHWHCSSCDTDYCPACVL
ncbi:putative uncharacterized protein LOC106413131 [Diplonema papillatum]|nr:putative uncharacterized protein LOC106413131 [Diplonema papillatum]KAJ9443482.1 putative uncharacterized protein LOC106413131 [Diplonema papillatum]KAJ9452516.1 putative uncharacterized protein LOC106413131 [Diplonema papillatum]